MRESKFRAKDRTTNKWVYGYPYKSSMDNWFILTGTSKYHLFEDTICQWTSLKDQNYKEIYDGDIVYGCFKYEQIGSDGGVIPDCDCLCKGIVKFSEQRLQWVLDIFWAESHISNWIKESGDSEIPLTYFEYESPEFPMDCLEVIGNIFDNPELNPQTTK